MLVRMSSASTGEAAETARSSACQAGRDLARARWTPSPVVARAVQVVISRSAELDDSQRAAIGAAVTTGPEDTDD